MPSLPLPGAALLGGTYLGLFTGLDGAPYALILLRKRPANRLTWAEAMSWALSHGASLPRQPEGLAIWAVLQRELPFDCYWLADTVEGYAIAAWAQEWNNGSQALYPRTRQCMALAVHRIPLTSLGALPELQAAEAAQREGVAA